MLRIVVSILLALGLLSCVNLLVENPKDQDDNEQDTNLQTTQVPKWARTVSTGSGSSGFHGVAVDSFGNVYTAGYQSGTGSYTYSSGVSVSGASSNDNVVVVKYNSSGTAQWAKSVSSGSASQFKSIAVDSSGNVYAVGYQYGTTSFNYGSGATAIGSNSGNNSVLVKYNSSGTAQWARSVSGSSHSLFYSVAVDSSGNVYAAGYQNGTGTYTYGTGVSVAGSSSASNVVLVKYNSSGNALWAKSVSSGSDTSIFLSVAVDSLGNVYVAGYQFGNGSYTYGSGISVAGSSSLNNAVLVKYDSNGNALWAKSVTSGSNHSCFNSVTVDSAGNVYAAGYQTGTGTYTYGTGVSVAGSSSANNVVLVKYNSSGTAQWARTVSSGSDDSIFFGIAVDSAGNVYAAGYQMGIGSYVYGIGVSISGPSNYNNVVLVKYNSSGTAQWARTVTSGSIGCKYNSIAVDTFGNVYATGAQFGNAAYTYGTGATATGLQEDENVVLVKYGP